MAVVQTFNLFGLVVLTKHIEPYRNIYVCEIYTYIYRCLILTSLLGF